MTTPIEILKDARQIKTEKAEEIKLEIQEWEQMLKNENEVIMEFDQAIELLAKSAMMLVTAPKTLADKTEEPLTQKHFRFEDCNGSPLTVNECTSILNTIRYGKRMSKIGQIFTIRADNTESVLKATWDELIDFYDALPDRMPLKNITGINKDKVAMLTQFYCEHPNFTCRKDTLGKGSEGNTILLVKDEVVINNNTAPLERHVDVETP